MKTTGLFLALVLTVYGHNPYGSPCILRQWEGLQTFYTGTLEGDTPTFIQTTGRISFDANNSRIAAFTSGSQDGRSFNRDFIFLFDKNAVYIIEDEKCSAETLDIGFPSLCIPDHFAFKWARTWYGLEHFGYQLWLLGFFGSKSSINYSIELDAEILVVATQQIHGTLDNVPFMQTSHTVNYTKGIQNPDAFDLPSTCKTAQTKGKFKLPVSMHGLFLP